MLVGPQMTAGDGSPVGPQMIEMTEGDGSPVRGGECSTRRACNRFCEAMNFAGIYCTPRQAVRRSDSMATVTGRTSSSSSGAPGATSVDVRLASYSEMWTDVLAAWPSGVAPGFRCVLQVATGDLLGGSTGLEGEHADAFARTSQGLGRFFHIGRRIEWSDAAPWGRGTWTWSAPIEGHSLRVPLQEDPVVMRALAESGGDALDFTRHRLRPLTDEESHQIMTSVGVVGEASAKPAAVILVGPSCAGKTTVLRLFTKQFGVDPETAVKRDSLAIHAVHAQYAALVAHGRANGGIWLTAWAACKPHWQSAKKKILEQACANRRDIIMFARGVKQGKRPKEGISVLEAAGYTVHILCVYANPRDIIERGLKREMSSGKRYKRDNMLNCALIPDNFRGFAHAIAAANGQFKVVLNANGEPPTVMLEGSCLGGTPVPEELAEAIDELCAFLPAKRATASALFFPGQHHESYDDYDPSTKAAAYVRSRCRSWPLASPCSSSSPNRRTHDNGDGTLSLLAPGDGGSERGATFA